MRGAEFLGPPEAELRAWRKTLASDKHPFGKIAIEELGLADHLFMYLDPDVIVQRPLEQITRHARTGWCMRQEHTKTSGNRWAMAQLRRAVRRGLLTEGDVTRETREFNTGVFAASGTEGRKVLAEWTELMSRGGWNSLRNSDPGASNAWHDQDFFRALIRHRHGALGITEFDGSEVTHMCANGHRWIVAMKGAFIDLRRFRPPTVVHFAGATWERFGHLRQKYVAGCELEETGDEFTGGAGPAALAHGTDI
jgi:hypothetical protein